MKMDDRPKPTLAIPARRNFALPERMAPESRKTYTPPAWPALNQWGLGGAWNVGAESGKLVSAPGKILFRFHSRDLHMVLGPAKNGTPVRFRLKLRCTNRQRSWIRFRRR